MEEIKVDVKLIIITICVAALVGTIAWAGYNIYLSLTKEENEGIKYFEGDMSSSIGDNSGKDSINNNQLDLSDIIIDDTFSINNTNISPKKEGWAKRIHRFVETGHYVTYYIPNDWKNSVASDIKNGIRIDASMLKLDNLTKETTYEEFLNKFIEKMEANEYFPNTEGYEKRQVQFNGNTFYVLSKDEYYNAKYIYFCLAYDQYAYYLEVSCSKEDYTEDLLKEIYPIFETFKVF